MKRRYVLPLAVLSCVGLTARRASADKPGYAASVFEPSTTGSDWFANESNDYRGKFRFAFGAVGDYAYRPVIGAYVPSNGVVKDSVLREQATIHAGVSLVVIDRLRFSAQLPIQVDAFGHAATVRGVTYAPPKNSQTIGDIRGSVDLRVLGEYGDAFTAAVGMTAWFPTGQQNSFTSDEHFRFEPHLNLAGDVGPFAWSARAGYANRPLAEDYINTRTGSTLTFGGGAGVRILDRHLLIGPELYGSTIVSSAGGTRDTPIEALMGVHLNVAHGFRVNAGAGTFLDHGYGAAVFRGLFGLEYFPEPEAPKVVQTAPPPPADRDHDGVLDNEDACPDTPGVRTNDPKTNGCPPPGDRDHDTVLDNEDACPDVPGIRTNDPKTNGCPGDRDGDGILDNEDACPDQPGIRTNDPKTNGCPDPDRDKDGILNEQDACPDEAGPKSNDPKTSGCPRVFIKAGLIQILEQPKFDFNKSVIKPESDSLLTEVAKLMTDHPEIKSVRVEGHTDNVGSADYNKKLSQQRAESVVKWLNSHGVDSKRLNAKGMGKDSPLVPNDTDLNRALNRRVEFHIEDQAPTTKEVVKTPQGNTVTAPPRDPVQPTKPATKP